MANLQYIGARYVPKFFENPDDQSNDWKAGVDYEALTIVTYNNDSYTSKKVVPDSVGNPADNPQYWACTTKYTAALMALQTTVGLIDNFVGSAPLSTDSQILSGGVNELKTADDMLRSCVVTPEMFGAAGDGVTDDTDEVQEALSTGKIVVILNTYKVSASLNVPKGVSILGGSLIFDFSDGLYNGLVLHGDNCIDGVAFTDSGTNIFGTSGKIIYGSQVSNISITRCKFSSIHAGYCGDFYHSTNIKFNFNVINVYSYAGFKMHAACSHCEICNNFVYDGRFNSAGEPNRYPLGFSSYDGTGADLGAAHHIKCNYNYIEDVTPLWEGIDSHGAYSYEIIGNTIKNVYKGIAMGAKATYADYGFVGVNSNIIIKDNDISVTALADEHCAGIGIGVIDGETHNIEISGNMIKTTGSNYTSAATAIIGIAAQSADEVTTPPTLRNVVISNNRLDATASTAQLGIVIAVDEVSNIEIDNNYVLGTDHSVNAAYALDVHTIDVAKRFKIRNNIFNGFTRSCRFPSDNYTGNELLEYEDNDDNGVYQGQIASFPRASFPSTTFASYGAPGQFVKCSVTTSTVFGWYRNLDNWVEVSGTVVS